MEDRYLFKGKRVDNGEWVIGHYVKGLNMFAKEVHLIFEPTTIFYSSRKTDGWNEIDPDTICQCTGLKDKKGSLIWKNDIVKDTVIYGVVKWDYANARYVIDDREDGYQDYSEWWQETEVIGNIFDNPELLENEG